MDTINLIVPTCWQELTPKQLRYVYFLLSEGYDPVTVKTYCLCRWSGLEIIEPYGDGYTVRFAYNLHHITASQVAALIRHLDWLEQLPTVPIRLAVIGGHKAAPYDLAGVEFQNYLYCDNLYQGYLHTQNTDLLQEMASILYDAEGLVCSPEERISIFYWFASVKAYFARKFTHFFTSGRTSEVGDIQAQLTEQTNSQIRALTKGDITKEKEVLTMDVWRALTELDAQAADYEDMQRQMKNV